MLHGRDAEQGEIDRLLAAARTGRSGVLALTGEAGIGKSALLDHAAARAPGWPVLRTAGVESEAELPFSALHLLFTPVRDHVAKLPEAQAAALTGTMGDRFLVGLAALTLLSDLGPLLCLVDDVHWLDRGTADALLFAARRLNAEGIVMIFAGRSGLGVPELALGGLPCDAAEALLAERAADLAPEVRRRIIEEAGGNPLALLELPLSLTPAQRAGRLSPLPSLVDAGPPSERVRRLFHTQIGRLPGSARTALLVAAADDTGDLDLVLRAASRVGAGAGDLDAAERANLIVLESGGLTFRHPLIRTAAYRSASYFERIAAHNALAAELQGVTHVDRRAWHRAAAATGPDEDVADELERTAERARDRQATVAASAAYERAAELTADPPRAADRLVSAAELAMHVGQTQRASGLTERASDRGGQGVRLARVRAAVEFECGDPSAAGRILLDGARCAASGGPGAGAARDPGAAAQMLADAIRHAAFGGDRELARAADTMLRALALPPDPSVRTLARGMGVVARLIEGQAVPDLSAVRAVTEMAARWPLPALATSLSLMIGEEEAAHRHADTMVAQCRERGLAGLLPEALTLLAQAQMLRGRHDEARASAVEALAIAGDIRQAPKAGQLSGALAWLAAAGGDTAGCAEFAARSEDVVAGRAMASWALGLSELGHGRASAALVHLTAIEHTFICLYAAADLVEAAVLGDRTDLAARPAGRLASWAASTRRPWTEAALSRTRGLLCGGEEAGEHFAHAVHLHETTADQPFEHGRAELLYGKWLRRRRRTEARGHLRAALERFEAVGAAPWAAQAQAELQATGVAGQPRGEGPLDRLTPQERQVVRLAAAGLSNREIGARLFLSPRTVGHHLYKAYPKLGVASRTELGHYLEHVLERPMT
ncbi:AAA family ATPase [Nonomuraea sp. NPDC050556]|uniref:AAA family ATPase n=1 Tax=Nonomuraea sp. NPDC050556 TaxID=3364369 RepID=UPI0037B90A75